jgi:ABC-2 type transport system permease protein
MYCFQNDTEKMSKIGLIIEREYLTRVRKRSFILMSLLGPLLLVLTIGLVSWIATSTGDTKIIEVIDESHLFEGKFEDIDKVKFVFTQSTLDAAKQNFQKNKHDGLLYIPPIQLKNPEGITLFSEKTFSMMLRVQIERTIRKEVENLKLTEAGIDKKTLADIRSQLKINTIALNEDTDKKSSAEMASIAGYIASTMIYMFILLYGVQVMRGVLEEKTNRIVEVIISSVRPIELMIGKILGIAGVALTQFLIWILVSVAATSLLGSLFTTSGEKTTFSAMKDPQISQAMEGLPINELSGMIGSLNIPLLVGCFLFYFLGGYLMYASLYGAIGAASDSETDTQQFMMPVTIPAIAALMVNASIMNDPNSQLAFWFSIFPLTSPISMMIRLPFIGFNWEVALSMGLLVLGFIGSSWLGARIYRVGILMYGKKVTYKELSKWLFYSKL